MIKKQANYLIHIIIITIILLCSVPSAAKTTCAVFDVPQDERKIGNYQIYGLKETDVNIINAQFPGYSICFDSGAESLYIHGHSDPSKSNPRRLDNDMPLHGLTLDGYYSYIEGKRGSVGNSPYLPIELEVSITFNSYKEFDPSDIGLSESRKNHDERDKKLNMTNGTTIIQNRIANYTTYDTHEFYDTNKPDTVGRAVVQHGYLFVPIDNYTWLKFVINGGNADDFNCTAFFNSVKFTCLESNKNINNDLTVSDVMGRLERSSGCGGISKRDISVENGTVYIKDETTDDLNRILSLTNVSNYYIFKAIFANPDQRIDKVVIATEYMRGTPDWAPAVTCTLTKEAASRINWDNTDDMSAMYDDMAKLIDSYELDEELARTLQWAF